MRTPLLAGLVTAAVLLASAAAVDGLRLEPEGTDIPLYTRYAGVGARRAHSLPRLLLRVPAGSLAASWRRNREPVGPCVRGPLRRHDAGGARAHRARLRGSSRRDARIAGPARADPGLIALCPLLLGPIALKRFDAVPSLLTVVALLLLVRRRVSWSAFVLGVATAVKLYPLLLLRWSWPRRSDGPGGLRSRRAARLRPAAPFSSSRFSCSRPAASRRASGGSSTATCSSSRPSRAPRFSPTVARSSVGIFGEAASYALGGSRGTALGLLTTATLLAGLLLVWWRTPRLARSGDGVVLGFAATIAVVVAVRPGPLAAVPDPLVPLCPSCAGSRVGGDDALAGACILTNVWFPDRYSAVVSSLDGGSIVLLFARNALLVALAAVLVVEAWRVPAGVPE